ncbi:MAG: NAD(P)H-dependent glycerol-3-phosphate dehydrogenase [Thermoanaerobaculia bacterium]
MRVTVVGAGSWGSALAELAGRCEHDVLLWAHDPRVAEAIEQSRSNPVYLPAAQFPANVRVTSDLDEAAAHSETVVMVTPSHHYRGVLERLAARWARPVRIVSATKGIEIESLQRISEVSRDVLGDRLGAFAVLSGPTFAVEVSRGDPTAAVVASEDETFAANVQEAFSCGTFRLYRSDDVAGVELGGSLKNVIAIAAGAIEGLGLGSNTLAALITRGLHEIRRLGVACGGRPETFAGLAGMGDLVLTCTGALSRNRSVGVALGSGKQLDEILRETRLVAEGVKTCRAARELASRFGVEMPITEEMDRVLYERESPRSAIQRLMSRALRSEFEADR